MDKRETIIDLKKTNKYKYSTTYSVVISKMSM